MVKIIYSYPIPSLLVSLAVFLLIVFFNRLIKVLNSSDNKEDYGFLVNPPQYSARVMLYNVTIEDIERAKQWAWKVAYATIAAQGALLALFNNTNVGGKIDPSFGLLTFTFLSIIISAFGISYIKYSNNRLEAFRWRRNRVEKSLGNGFSSILESTRNGKKEWPLWIIVSTTTVIVIVIMWMSRYKIIIT